VLTFRLVFWCAQVGVAGDGSEAHEVSHVRGLNEALQGAVVVGHNGRSLEEEQPDGKGDD
jgi:hypothetical protein